MNVSMRSGMTVLRIEKIVFCFCWWCCLDCVGVCVCGCCMWDGGVLKGDFTRYASVFRSLHVSVVRVRFWRGVVVRL